MMTSFYNLLKYAATGIASPDMTYFDKLRASTLMGGVVQTLTGQPPLSFKSDGSPLISWSMKGNGSQTGTPTPDAPIMPTFCGVRTANLFHSGDKTTTVRTVTVNFANGVLFFNGTADSNGGRLTALTDTIKLTAGTYNISLSTPLSIAIFLQSSSDNTKYVALSANTKSKTFVILETGSYFISANFVEGATYNDTAAIMLNSGSTALPYEPFGWAEKITCAGQTTPVYLGQVSTVRRIGKVVLTGSESWIVWNGNYFSSVIDNMTINNSRLFCTHFVDDGTVGIRIVSGTAKLKVASAAVSDFATDLASFKAYLAQQYSNETPVTIWYVLNTETTGITNEPLAKIGDYADELNSTDAAVTIPTAKGQNTLTVETDLQPSEMTITYRG